MIHPHPVSLEPQYDDLTDYRYIDFNYRPARLEGRAIEIDRNVQRYDVWLSPDHVLRWDRAEQFLRQLTSVSSRLGLEIIGNNDGIYMSLFCHEKDEIILDKSFSGKLTDCGLSRQSHGGLESLECSAWHSIRFREFYPASPYFHLMTRPEDLRDSPYESLVASLSSIKPPGLGVFQVLFQPTSPAHDWHLNIQKMTDMEYILRLVQNVGAVQRYPQQTPSGDLHNMATRLEYKAHNDKPLFASVVRVAVLNSSDEETDLDALSVFINLFRQGGCSLNYLSDRDFLNVISYEAVRAMFCYGLTHRSGFLVNSEELVGLVHVPPISVLESFQMDFNRLEPLSLGKEKLMDGTPIGSTKWMDKDMKICIPDKARFRHVHIIGKPNYGKSLLEEHMILHDIEKGHGVAVVDPHGDLIERLLCLIPETEASRVIYLNPAYPDWVPIWNPMQRIPGQDAGRMADDLIGVLKSFINGWGDRMEHLLRHGIFALLHISHSTLLDVCDILRGRAKESEELRRMVNEVLENEVARQFWEFDFDHYSEADMAPPKHKLSKLLVSDTVGLMLSQPHSTFHFSRIMDEGTVFLADLSGLGSEVRNILGGFLLAIMYMTALGRSAQAVEDRRSFHAYLDEAPRFVTDTLEDIIAEMRKYKVSLTLAHQYLRQFNARKIDALASVGTTVSFNVDIKDATHLAKDFQKLVKVDDFIRLEQGEVIARIGSEIVKLRTAGPRAIPRSNAKERIIQSSLERYYRPSHQVREIIRKRSCRSQQPFTPLVPSSHSSDYPDRSYDEF